VRNRAECSSWRPLCYICDPIWGRWYLENGPLSSTSFLPGKEALPGLGKVICSYNLLQLWLSAPLCRVHSLLKLPNSQSAHSVLDIFLNWGQCHEHSKYFNQLTFAGTKYLRKSTYRMGSFILTQFQRFQPTFTWPCCFGSVVPQCVMVRSTWQRHCSPHFSPESNKRGRRSQNLNSPF
jgi:hypothetical protein